MALHENFLSWFEMSTEGTWSKLYLDRNEYLRYSLWQEFAVSNRSSVSYLRLMCVVNLICNSC